MSATWKGDLMLDGLNPTEEGIRDVSWLGEKKQRAALDDLTPRFELLRGRLRALGKGSRRYGQAESTGPASGALNLLRADLIQRTERLESLWRYVENKYQDTKRDAHLKGIVEEIGEDIRRVEQRVQEAEEQHASSSSKSGILDQRSVDKEQHDALVHRLLNQLDVVQGPPTYGGGVRQAPAQGGGGIGGTASVSLALSSAGVSRPTMTAAHVEDLKVVEDSGRMRGRGAQDGGPMSEWGALVVGRIGLTSYPSRPKSFASYLTRTSQYQKPRVARNVEEAFNVLPRFGFDDDVTVAIFGSRTDASRSRGPRTISSTHSWSRKTLQSLKGHV